MAAWLERLPILAAVAAAIESRDLGLLLEALALFAHAPKEWVPHPSPFSWRSVGKQKPQPRSTELIPNPWSLLFYCLISSAVTAAAISLAAGMMPISS
jgi:hypothetical protein